MGQEKSVRLADVRFGNAGDRSGTGGHQSRAGFVAFPFRIHVAEGLQPDNTERDRPSRCLKAKIRSFSGTDLEGHGS